MVQQLVMESNLRLSTRWYDYVFIVIYFVLVLGIGFAARRSIAWPK